MKIAISYSKIICAFYRQGCRPQLRGLTFAADNSEYARMDKDIRIEGKAAFSEPSGDPLPC